MHQNLFKKKKSVKVKLQLDMDRMVAVAVWIEHNTVGLSQIQILLVMFIENLKEKKMHVKHIALNAGSARAVKIIGTREIIDTG